MNETLLKPIKKFSDFNIKAPEKVLTGDRINIKKLFGKKITILWIDLRDSKLEDATSDKCMYFQIIFNNEKRIFWSSSKYLMDAAKEIEQKDGYPVDATINEVDGRYQFSD